MGCPCSSHSTAVSYLSNSMVAAAAIVATLLALTSSGGDLVLAARGKPIGGQEYMHLIEKKADPDEVKHIVLILRKS
jgi:hypothetical protein